MQGYLKGFQYIIMICLILSGGCITFTHTHLPLPEQPSTLRHTPCYCHLSGIPEPTPIESEPETKPEPKPGPPRGNKYAVLISAGIARDTELAIEYWNDLVLQYNMLIENGFPEDQICVLYDKGQDYNPIAGHSITDLPVSIANIESVFKALGGIGTNTACVKRALTDEDLLYVWWMGHGSLNYDELGTCILYMPISGSKEVVVDTQLHNFIDYVSRYSKRIIAIMTCHSGGILDDINIVGSKTVTLTSSSCEESSSSYDPSLTCDRLNHAEFSYNLTCALRQYACDSLILPPVDGNVDGYSDGYVSLLETYLYVLSPLNRRSTPQIGDPDSISSSAYLNGP
ncbi:MAG: hypothetical protein AYP45_07030 [Candidatus Brocadia carolinensis]|uniref:Peptidase C13 family protein n=1 Tax=Candidatus Brocadia carolinensis TaxID=1004156 RepID=A0A1V4AUF4_9BACT|nr:MAG: hypothetical protein AYP45_07030 [Candidatus Brocadia caroliniensis]